MKVTIYILLFTIGLLGCFHSSETVDKSIEQQLEGNWKTEYFQNKRKKTAYIFTFQDSTCSYLYPWGNYSKYWINEDTLYIKERIRKRRNKISGGKRTYKYLIDIVTDEVLDLKPITDETKRLTQKNIVEDLNIIRLSKVVEKYNWPIERIGFYSTGCYGTCPSMHLEIDSVGNFLFNGKRFTEKEGLYTGKLLMKELEELKSTINSIQLDSLHERYSANWTDDQTCGVSIQTKDRIYESSAYGYNKEPIELRILFHKLMNLYQNVKLKRDSTILEEFQFSNILSKMVPPPPPPQIHFNGVAKE